MARHKDTYRHTFTRLHLYRGADLQPFRTLDSNHVVPRVNSSWNPRHQQSNSCWHPFMTLSRGVGGAIASINAILQFCLFSFKLRHMKSMLDITALLSHFFQLYSSISDVSCFSLFPSLAYTTCCYCTHLQPCPCSGMICGIPVATMSRHSKHSKQCETCNWYEKGNDSRGWHDEQLMMQWNDFETFLVTKNAWKQHQDRVLIVP